MRPEGLHAMGVGEAVLHGMDVCVAVAVGSGVSVGGLGVAVGGTGVSVGGTGVNVGGTGVGVGGTGVAVGGRGVAVGSAGVAAGVQAASARKTSKIKIERVLAFIVFSFGSIVIRLERSKDKRSARHTGGALKRRPMGTLSKKGSMF